jgi:cell division protein ZapB
MSNTTKTADAAADKTASSSTHRSARDRQLELELNRLTRRIEELLVTLDTLKEENRALRQRHETLANERAALMQKSEQVRNRVEAMIGRLKTLEHGA